MGSNRRAASLISLTLGLVGLLPVLGGSGCAGASKAQPTWSLDVLSMLDGADHTFYRPKLMWRKALPYIVTDLKTSRQAESTFFATIPDPDRRWVPSGYRVFNMLSNGAYRFDKLPPPYKMQIKSLHTSRSGRHLVFANYQDQVVLLSSAGKKIWAESGNCRPIVLEELNRVLCYHDDDAEPTIAFTAWPIAKKAGGYQPGPGGERYPISGDILSLQVSESERWLGLGLTDQRLHLIGEDPIEKKLVLKREIKLPGEVASLSLGDSAASISDTPLSIALLLSHKEPEPLLWVGLREVDGTLKSGQLQLDHVAQSVEVSPSGDWVVAYSNTKFGQYLFGYSIVDVKGKLKLALKWKRGHPKSSDYSHNLQKVPGGVMVGYEQIENNNRTSVSMAVSFSGELLWSIPLEHNEGAYLYVQDFAPGARVLFTATDDGKFSAFKMMPSKKRD